MSDPRAIAKLVLEPDFTVKGALAVVQPQQLAEAIEVMTKPPQLRELEPNLDGEVSARVRQHLKAIGMANWPRMPDKSAWLDANLLALSNIPARTLILAAREAVFRTYTFENEVAAGVREEAEKLLNQHALALYRMNQMRAEIERATNATPRLEDKTEDWTADGVEEFNALMIKLGLTSRMRMVDGVAERYESQPENGEKQEDLTREENSG